MTDEGGMWSQVSGATIIGILIIILLVLSVMFIPPVAKSIFSVFGFNKDKVEIEKDPNALNADRTEPPALKDAFYTYDKDDWVGAKDVAINTDTIKIIFDNPITDSQAQKNIETILNSQLDIKLGNNLFKYVKEKNHWIYGDENKVYTKEQIKEILMNQEGTPIKGVLNANKNGNTWEINYTKDIFKSNIKIYESQGGRRSVLKPWERVPPVEPNQWSENKNPLVYINGNELIIKNLKEKTYYKVELKDLKSFDGKPINERTKLLKFASMGAEPDRKIPCMNNCLGFYLDTQYVTGIRITETDSAVVEVTITHDFSSKWRPSEELEKFKEETYIIPKNDAEVINTFVQRWIN